MRLLILFVLAISAFAEEPQVAVLQAEIEHLKAQLALANQQLEIAVLPQVMRTRLAAIDAAAKLEAAKASVPKPEPTAEKPAQ